MMKRSWVWFLLVVMCVVVVPAWAKMAPEGSPTRAIQDLDDTISKFRTGKPLSPADEQFNRDLKHTIIHGTFDVRELCRLALSSHWDRRADTEQNRFVDLMIALLEERALFSKEQAASRSKKEQKYRVTYLGEKFLDGTKTKASVTTKLAIPSERLDVQLSYKLSKRETEWKIYDIIVDGASLLENYRYQFNDIITKHGYDDLVGRMTKKLDEIKGKRQGTS